MLCNVFLKLVYIIIKVCLKAILRYILKKLLKAQFKKITIKHIFSLAFSCF